MNNDNNIYNNHLMIKYYIFCGLFQLIWAIGVIGFVVFLILHFNNPWYLFFSALVLLKPYIALEWKFKSEIKDRTDENNKHNPSDYGSNNPL